MKKFLSLVLALAMAMSLVVVNTSAAEYTDDQDITYGEAVDVISEIGIVDGYTDGSFNPTNGLTRGAAAKIICNLILGPTTAAELHATTAPFSDVSINNEFAGYIAYCSQQGIISGYADGTFRPANPLTGYAFMKMLLGALGYDQYTEGYTGENWSIAVAKQAIGIGLNAGLEGEFNGVDYVNREEAALYVLNTLQADLVSYDTVINTTINGQTVTIGNSEPKSREWGSSATRRNNIKNDIYIQFAEEYFNRLVKAEDVDVFGRPAYTWTYNSNEIGTYVDYSLLVEEYTTSVTGRDLYNALSASTIRENDLDVYIDGVDSKTVNSAVFDASVLVRGNDNTVGETGNGVLTQVFFDQDDELITIAIINTYLVKATSDYNERRDSVNFTVYGATTSGTGGEYVKDAGPDPDGATSSATVYGEDFPVVEETKEGDIFLATIADKDVQTLSDAEVIDEITLTSFRRGTSVTGGGETYNYADSATYDPDVLDQYNASNMKDTTYRLYLDQYGYMIGIEEIDAADNYVFIAGYENFGSVLTSATTDAFAIFTDGTTATITVKNAATTKNKAGSNWDNSGDANENGWYTYTVDSNDRYTLTPVVTTLGTNDKAAQFQDSTDGKTIDKSHVSLKADSASVYAYGNDDSVFLGAKVSTIGGVNLIDGVQTTITGVRNVNMALDDSKDNGPSVESGKYNGDPVGAYVLYDDDYYVIAAVVVAENLANSENYALIIDGVVQEDYDSTADEWTWYRTAIVNGVETTLRERGDTLQYIGAKSTEGNLTTMDWVKLYYDADGYVIGADHPSTLNWVSSISGSTELVNGVEVFNVSAETGGYDKEDVILVGQGINPAWGNYGLTLQGQTLYTGNITADLGISLLPDANAVVMTTEEASPVTNDYGDYDVEYYDTVRAAVDSLIDYDTTKSGINFNGQVWFVMNEGVASSVIIRVDNQDTFTPGVPGNTGNLNVNGLSFGVGGMIVNIKNETGITLDNTYVYSVTVRNADDALIYSGNATGVATIATGTDGNVTFGGYTATPSTSGNYTVTLTITDGTGAVRFTTTNVVGTV